MIERLITDTIVQHLNDDHPAWRRPMLRDAHAKHHLVVRAELHVDGKVPESLRHGLFARPGVYPAWIRFSNAFKVRPDLSIDARGMAIKVMDLPQEARSGDGDTAQTQDFLAVTHHTFFARTPEDFVDIPAVLARGKGSTGKTLVGLATHFAWPPRRWCGGLSLVRSFRWLTSPLVGRYFSQTPYHLGPHHVKFALVPRQKSGLSARLRLTGRWLVYLSSMLTRVSVTRWDNYLQEALRDDLNRGPATFDFQVQMRPDKTDLNDAVRGWSRWRSPYQKVATITIPRQAFSAQDLADNSAFGQHLSFTPWHTLAAHEPAGSINQARRLIYDTVSAHRHRVNVKQRVEPTGSDSPHSYLARL